MELLDTSDASLRKAGKAIADGLLVAIPTETVYGLGADAFNAGAVARIFEAKARPHFDPLIVHIAGIGNIEKAARSVPPKAMLLAEKLWPGPLTLILPKRREVPDIVTSGLDTVAVRFPLHPVARKIIEYSGTLVAAPSANPFGYISPTTAGHVASMLSGRVDMIVDGGPCEVGVESTILDVTGPVPAILRLGGMSVEKIQEIIGEVRLPGDKSGPGGAVTSPGQLPSHYAPHARLCLFEYGSLPGALSAASGKEYPKPGHALKNEGSRAVIVFDGARADALRDSVVGGNVFVLSPGGDMREAAARLFALMHDLDNSGFDVIFAERVPDAGLGRAINDRLYRASRKS